MSRILQVNALSIAFKDKGQLNWVVNDVNFDLECGQTLALLGESGSGKSLTASAIMQLLPPSARVDETSDILFNDTSVLNASAHTMQTIRGRKIGLIFQDALSALNPIQTIGQQLQEALKLHTVYPPCHHKARIASLLEEAELKTQHANYYPHQLSGGMQQRALIALALANDPNLLLCDESTTALDVTLQSQLLGHLKRLQRQRNLSIVFITHHIKLACDMAHDAVIMQKGRIVEQGTLAIKNPQHPYSQSLRQAASVEYYRSPLKTNASNRLEVNDLHVGFKKGRQHIPIIQGIDLTLKPGETLGLVGESGSGKTTLARTLLGLIPAQRLQCTWYDQRLRHLGPNQAQMIFQNPTTALNPKWTLEALLMEGILAGHPKPDSDQAEACLRDLLTRIDLPISRRYDYPCQFSGGQCQRIAIARSLAAGAKLLICDEPTSALDVATQAQLLQWLEQQQDELGLSLILITHDFALIKRTAHRVMVMQQGQIVEHNHTEALFKHPQHPYTQQLLNAAYL